MNHQHFVIAFFLSLSAACASSTSAGGDTAPRTSECAQEIALTCSEGDKDGCLLPHPKDNTRQLTVKHICVAAGEERSAVPCEQEIAKVCKDGYQDACLVTPRAADVHVCVATGA